MNNQTVFYGGYYAESQSAIFCADSNSLATDVAYCITPNYCNNKQNLTFTGITDTSTDVVEMKSYKSLSNNSSIYQEYGDSISVYCSGEKSCIDSVIGARYIHCSGSFSCLSSNFIDPPGGITLGFFDCYGTASCSNVLSSYLSPNVWFRNMVFHATASLGFESVYNINNISGPSYDYGIDAYATLAAMDSVFNIDFTSITDSNHQAVMQVSGYYGLFNVTIKCNTTKSRFRIACYNSGPHIFGTIDESCQYYNLSTIIYTDFGNNVNCSIINSTEEMNRYDNNSYQMIDEIRQLIKLSENYSEQCDLSDDNSYLKQDIGSPLYATLDAQNENLYGLVCCRGYESCGYSRSIYSNLGNILCSGENSCYESEFIWTGENSNVNQQQQQQQQNNGAIEANILCTGKQSCSGSIMDAESNILCSGFESCTNTFILGCTTLYCTKHSCNAAVIRQTKTIYLIENNTDILIYSGYIGEASIYFRGDYSGDQVTYRCNYGDVCTIYCGRGQTCSNTTTFIYCDGKCKINCEDDTKFNPGSTDCVQIVSSLAPSFSPTDAPSNAPTFSPTNTPTAPPTLSTSVAEEPTFAERLDNDISYWFEWVLLAVSIIVGFLVLTGTIASKSCDENELFEWSPLLASLFHINDFFSDVFFCMKLGLFAFADTSENLSDNVQMVFFYLFLGCVACIVIPVIATLVGLYFQIDKWENDATLQNTEVTRWIEKNITMVFLVAIVTGSSFTAISICNCYLLKLSFFCMGLSGYHANKYQTKRFFTITMIENVPQLGMTDKKKQKTKLK